MKDPTGSRLVTAKNAVEFLGEPRNHPFLEALMDGECTMGQLAERIHQPLQRVFRRVNRMIGLGLVEVTGFETRTGRPIRYYRAVSERFFVPFSDKSFEEFLLEANLKFEHRFVAAIAAEWIKYAADNAGWGTSFVLSRHGRLVIQAPAQLHSGATAPPSPAVFSRFCQWNLNESDAEALMNELTGLVEKYAARNGSGQQTFLVRLGLSPEARAPNQP
jgi:MarR family